MRRGLFFCFLFFSIVAYAQESNGLVVPVAGNSWVTKANGDEEEVSDNGWQHWQHADAVWSTYIKVAHAGKLQVGALLNVPSGESSLSFSVQGVSHDIQASGSTDKLYAAGSWDITKPGYIKIETKGLRKTGDVFARVRELHISGSAVDSTTSFVKNNEGNYFYWGRRGPSVHINYELPAGVTDVEWFYNEITVPVGQDVIGSYFMADGFAEGYFGMQVNSSTERRFIFSVWSPFKTDNPKEIPEDKKIILVKAGPTVEAAEFGNEGSGGHSHVVYNWKAGQTYKFLLRGQPVANNYTNYTAWIFDNEKNNWFLIASFNRPATSTYLKRLHSFLENFIPEAGNITRMAFYHNQWIKPASGDWQPLTKMMLTADATAGKGYRKDYGGGVENNMFYLKNGGFFNETAELRKPFSITASSQKPSIDLRALDKIIATLLNQYNEKK